MRVPTQWSTRVYFLDPDFYVFYVFVMCCVLSHVELQSVLTPSHMQSHSKQTTLFCHRVRDATNGDGVIHRCACASPTHKQRPGHAKLMLCMTRLKICVELCVQCHVCTQHAQVQ